MKHRKLATIAAAGSALLLLAGCGSTGGAPAAEGGDGAYVTVVKITGVGWFDRMEVGVRAFAERTGIDARQEGGDDASPEKQVQIVQDLIAQAPTAITVVPNSPEALESVLASAREQGIIVVAHEAAGMTNVDIDIEAFDNLSYGSLIMDNLADCMGSEGEYVSFVGGLTAKTHMDWVNGALDNQTANFPT